MPCRVGIDIGGTFTDFALLSSDTGELTIHKQLTTPSDPAVAVLDGLPVLLRKAGVRIDDVEAVVHGTTLVTNALIERRGACTAMLCTRGFADVLDIARERRYDMYDLGIQYPAPLVPRPLRIEIDERIDAKGRITTAIDLAQVRREVRRLAETERIAAVAVCFLNSPANDTHERAAAATISETLSDLYVSTSADVFPFIREYDRWTTATMNAYAQPMFDQYLNRLEIGLKQQGFVRDFYVMTSAGGTVRPETARRYPVRMLESGPAAGVLQATSLGNVLKQQNLLSFDMGGTTAKGALARNSAPLKRYEMEVARVHEFKMGSGLPARIPVLDMIEIGAGGGSIAHIGTRGVIAVGPKSAGADPGPACYGLGGAEPTLTDANLLLGYLDEAYFLGGDMRLDKRAAETAVMDRIGKALEINALRAAWGIHETVNEDVARAFRNHASERGFDYRASTMIAFGGSGPAHACRVARKLRVPTVIFPAGAGVMSAIGLLASPPSFQMLRSDRIAVAELTAEGFQRRFAALEVAADAELPSIEPTVRTVRRHLDMRYRGQGYELEVEMPATDDEDGPAVIPSLFSQAYSNVFGKDFPDQPIEIINWKVEVSGPAAAGAGDYRLQAAGDDTEPRARQIYVPEADDLRDVPVYSRYGLAPGGSLIGPTIVEERESTVVIGTGDTAVIDELGSIVVSIGTGAAP